MGHFHPLEVVGRGSETQPQVGENSNKLSRIRVKFFSIPYSYAGLVLGQRRGH